MLTVGSRVGDDGRYELRRALDSGAFGCVFEAWDLAEDARVAVKVLRPDVRLDQVLLEARLHRRLSAHSRIVTMRNVMVSAAPSPLIALDYISGGSLKGLLARRRPTVVESQRWLKDTLEALAHAHSGTHTVLHRDIKPSNLLLGEDNHVMLTDFGVAEDSLRRVLPAPGMYPLTLPPEFLTTAATIQTDLWLVGMLGWQLLTGMRPDLSAAHAGTLEMPHRISLEVPMRLSRAIMEALEVDPGRRPHDAGLMFDRIAAVPIHVGWNDRTESDPTVVQVWEADANGGGVIVRIRHRTRDFEVTAVAPPGRRLSQRRRAVCASLPLARRQARAWLEQAVSGTPL